MENSAVILGFAADECSTDSTWITDDACVSRIGGRPVFTVAPLPQPTCLICNGPLIQLLQLYAPDSDEDNESNGACVNRFIYLLACQMGECHSSRKPGAIRCFRTQCTDDELAVITNTSTLCAVCGLEGDKRCGKCKSVQYCSKQHQILHWNEHRDSCCSSSNNTASSTSSLLFPVREIITDDDDYEGRVKEELLMEGSVSGVNGMQVSTSVTADVEEEEEVMAVDKAFLRFQKRVRFAPDQILRYVRTGETQEKMEEPLWVSDESKPSASDIPDCSSCGQQRTFEFQVMPQLLNYLNLNHVATESLDFGTLLVYTCDSPQCRQKSGKYVEEFVWRQDFSQHSAALSSKQ